MRRKYTALVIALLLAAATLPFVVDKASAEPTFRITKKIYGQGRYGDEDSTEPSQKTPAKAQPEKPQPVQAEESDHDQLPAGDEVEAVKPAPAPEVSIPAEPLPPVATPAMKPVEAVKKELPPEKTVKKIEMPRPKQLEEKKTPVVSEEKHVAQPVPETNDKGTVVIPAVKSSKMPTKVKSIPEPAPVQHPVEAEEAAVQAPERAIPEPAPQVTVQQTRPPEVTPKTTFVEPDNQPPHTQTFAEKAESLQPAKNEELFKEALKHYNAATRLGQQGDFKEAVVEYQKALYIHPAFPDARVGLAVSYASLGQWLPMINELEMSLQLKDLFIDKFNLVQAHYNLGAAYCVQGNAKRAKTELDFVREAKHPNIKQLEMFIESHCQP